MSHSRRKFLEGLASAGAAMAMPRAGHATLAADTFSARENGSGSTSCPFRLSVINDEISQDFDHACSVAANDFGLQWIEIRGMWDKNITELTAVEVDNARKILEKYKLRVTDIASPLFKVNWPGAPQSPHGPKRDQFHADFDFKQQDKVLERCIDLAKAFQTDRIRCFDF